MDNHRSENEREDAHSVILTLVRRLEDLERRTEVLENSFGNIIRGLTNENRFQATTKKYICIVFSLIVLMVGFLLSRL